MLLIITVITAAGKTWFVVMYSLVRFSLVLTKEFKPGNQCGWSIFGQVGMKNFDTMPQTATDLYLELFSRYRQVYNLIL